MKKAITLGLAIAMLSSMATVASAGNDVLVGNNSMKDVIVSAKYDPSRNTKYSVGLTWGSLNFNYGAKETWNETNHAWDVTAETGRWTVADTNGDVLTVENNSSVPIKTSFTFAQDTENGSNVIGTFSGEGLTDNKLTLPVAEQGKEAKIYSVKFEPSGTISTTLTDKYTKIGTITVQITDA